MYFIPKHKSLKKSGGWGKSSSSTVGSTISEKNLFLTGSVLQSASPVNWHHNPPHPSAPPSQFLCINPQTASATKAVMVKFMLSSMTPGDKTKGKTTGKYDRSPAFSSRLLPAVTSGPSSSYEQTFRGVSEKGRGRASSVTAPRVWGGSYG